MNNINHIYLSTGRSDVGIRMMNIKIPKSQVALSLDT